ncbi:MAG TPA: FliH/SctL family protein [Bryobacteraceae bacterium]|jgi:flagellar assembly protein FliH|nr:FliH/SctL family protein [Bryobacteraceae bacterium]
MSSEILLGDENSAAPAFWRTVASARTARLQTARPDAAREAAQALEQARREAFEQGAATGRKDAEQQILPAFEKMARNLAELAQLRESLREEALQDLVRLATLIAARVVHREVVIDPDALAGLIKAAFSKLQAREISRVRMHPGLEPLVRKCLEQSGSPKNLILAADPALNPGELFFDTSQGLLDASVDTQLREIERGLIDKLGT